MHPESILLPLNRKKGIFIRAFLIAGLAFAVSGCGNISNIRAYSTAYVEPASGDTARCASLPMAWRVACRAAIASTGVFPAPA